jgi:site-specific recombinase XerD
MANIVPAHLVELTNLTEQVKGYAESALADSTRRAYKQAWQEFTLWCEQYGASPLPASPETLAAYLAHLAESLKVSTIQKKLSAISQAHQVAEVDNPAHSKLVRLTMKGMRNAKGTHPEQKAAAVTSDIQAMVNALPDNLLGVRDKALLLVGFAGAFRRSELVSIDVEDLEWRADGLAILLKRSKTDQEGEGTTKGIQYGRNIETCPVRALQAWLEASDITSGPVFRAVNRHGKVQPGRLSDRTVARAVKRAAEAASLDPDRYSGHSLRAGLATSAAAAGAQERDIMRQTGHKSVQMVRRYIRDGELFRDNVSGLVGL